MLCTSDLHLDIKFTGEQDLACGGQVGDLDQGAKEVFRGQGTYCGGPCIFLLCVTHCKPVAHTLHTGDHGWHSI